MLMGSKCICMLTFSRPLENICEIGSEHLSNYLNANGADECYDNKLNFIFWLPSFFYDELKGSHLVCFLCD